VLAASMSGDHLYNPQMLSLKIQEGYMRNILDAIGSTPLIQIDNMLG
jgi:hypothetical protein